MDNELPFGGLEPDDVTPEMYEQANRDLAHFLRVRLSDFQTLEDLSAHASAIGDCLRTIVLASGEIQQTGFEYKHPLTGENVNAMDRTWIIRKNIADHKIFVTATKTNHITKKVPGLATISGYVNKDDHQLSIFQINLPVGTDITHTGDNISDMSTYAVDWRSGKAQSYYPVRDYNNAQSQQGFVHVLQDGLKELLQVIPPAK